MLIEQLRHAEWEGGPQAHAELTTFVAFVRQQTWALDVVDDLIRGIQDPDAEHTEASIAGIIHVTTHAIHDWRVSGNDLDRCLRWMTDVAPHVPPELTQAWLIPLSRDRYASPPRAPELLPLVQIVAVNPKLLEHASDDILDVARASPQCLHRDPRDLCS